MKLQTEQVHFGGICFYILEPNRCVDKLDLFFNNVPTVFFLHWAVSDLLDMSTSTDPSSRVLSPFLTPIHTCSVMHTHGHGTQMPVHAVTHTYRAYKRTHTLTHPVVSILLPNPPIVFSINFLKITYYKSTHYSLNMDQKYLTSSQQN